MIYMSASQEGNRGQSVCQRDKWRELCRSFIVQAKKFSHSVYRLKKQLPQSKKERCAETRLDVQHVVFHFVNLLSGISQNDLQDHFCAWNELCSANDTFISYRCSSQFYFFTFKMCNIILQICNLITLCSVFGSDQTSAVL